MRVYHSVKAYFERTIEFHNITEEEQLSLPFDDKGEILMNKNENPADRTFTDR